jgi:hypothetical protein
MKGRAPKAAGRSTGAGIHSSPVRNPQTPKVLQTSPVSAAVVQMRKAIPARAARRRRARGPGGGGCHRHGWVGPTT